MKSNTCENHQQINRSNSCIDFQIRYTSDIISWLWSGKLKVTICHNVKAIFQYPFYETMTKGLNIWVNQKTGRHILKPCHWISWKRWDFTVQYSKTQVYGVSITFGIMFFFNFGFDISFLFMKSFVKKENFRFLLIWRCHISSIWNFSYYYQYDASGRLSLSNPARFWWLIIRVFENVSFREIHSWSDY